jgi:hypothetical protein
VCHDVLRDPNFFQLLDLIDEERAREVKAGGCSCGGVLHSARYPRKPRGIPRGLREADHRRRSFCCDACRQRHTPRSVVYLGRRVYVAAMVLLGSALRGSVSGRGLRELCAMLEVPRATLDRWCRWWNEQFPATRLWQGLRGRFMPPIAGALPGGLLERIGAADLATRISQALGLIAPLSTLSEGR